MKTKNNQSRTLAVSTIVTMAEEDDILRDLPSEDLSSASYSRLSGRQICIPESLPNHNAFDDSDGASSDRPPRLAERVASDKALMKGQSNNDEEPKMARRKLSIRSTHKTLQQLGGFGDLSEDLTVDEESEPSPAAEGNPLNSSEEIALDQPPRIAVRMASSSRGLSSTS